MKRLFNNTPDHLPLWRHFSQAAASVKDKLWTIASWLFTSLDGVLGFIAKDFRQAPLALQVSKLTAVMALVGWKKCGKRDTPLNKRKVRIVGNTAILLQTEKI